MSSWPAGRGGLVQRLTWSGPFLTSPDEREHRTAMARASAYLYAAGAALAILSLIIPADPSRNGPAIAAAAFAALAMAVVHVLVFDRLPVTLFQASGAFSVAIIAFGIHAAGETGGAYLAFFFWPVMYAFFFYRLTGAMLQLGCVGIAFAALLSTSGADHVGAAHAVVSLGTLGMAGLIILLLKQRLKTLVDGLRGAEATYRTLVEHLPLATYIDALDGSTRYIGPQIEPMLGYPRGEWLARPDFYAELLHAEDHDRVVEVSRRARASGDPFRGEYRLLARDGRVVWVLDETVVVRDDEGRSMFRQGFFLDITAQKQAEEATARLEAELHQAQKMESIGRLAGGIAHDFNNLLMAILGYGELAEKRSRTADGELRRHIREIRGAAERAASLTRQLLAFSRKQILQPMVLDLSAVVAGTDGMLRRLIGEDVAVVTDLEPGLGVLADPGQLQQVLVNLVVNARDAMPDGGTLTIRTSTEPHAPGSPALAPGEYVVLAVADTGCGIDAQTGERIFEPFFTTKEPGRGTGLGLSTVYGIVNQSGGEITVESAVGRGSTFRVYLPRAEPVSDEEKVVANREANGSGTILVVEDEAVVRRLVLEVLEDRGYRVLEASGPTEALDVAAAHDGPIDLLLTDVVMPEMSGRELAKHLGVRRPGTRLIYMSGYTDNHVSQHGVLANGVTYLQKPFSAEELSRKVGEMLSRAA